MKILVIISTFLFISNQSYSQTRKKDLNGEWLSKNDNGLFQKIDTVKFHQNINHFNQNDKSCNQIKWTFDKSKFKISDVNNCTEPGRVEEYNAKEKFKLKKTDFGQVIEIFREKELLDKFRIVKLNEKRIEKYPYDIKQMDLIRFDNLVDEKLYKYVDSLITTVLKYNPKLNESDTSGIKISGLDPNVKIRIRDGYSKNPEPLLIINGYPIENRDILKKLLFVETYGITYLTKDESIVLYGSRAVNGVVLLNTSEKRFKSVRKKYGR